MPSQRTANGLNESALTAPLLASRLERVRRRYRREVARVFAATILPIIIAVIWSGRWTLLGNVTSFSGAILWTGIAAMSAVGIFLQWHAPTIDDVARRADSYLGTAERLSSAQPMLGGAPRDFGPLGPALLHDAALHSEGLVRMRVALPVPAVSLIAALSIAVTSAVLMWEQEATGPALVSMSGQAAAHGNLETLSDAQIEQVRELIAAEAKRMNNPYLEAVANSLEQFQRNAQEMQPQERARNLASLLDHTVSAYGASRPSWLPQDTSNLAALSSGLERQAMASALAQNGSTAGSVPLPDEWDPNAADPALRSAEALQDLIASAGSAGTVGPLEMAGLDQPVGTPPRSNPFEPRPMDPGKLVAATPAGASLNAEAGASATGGLGSQALEGQHTQVLDGSFDTQMGISADSTGQGNLIRIEAAPERQYTEVEDAAVAAADVDGKALRPVFQTVVSAERRPMVARYFTNDPNAIAGR